jgi:hypothetical protein
MDISEARCRNSHTLKIALPLAQLRNFSKYFGPQLHRIYLVILFISINTNMHTYKYDNGNPRSYTEN